MAKSVDELPDLKQILGSMIFAANRPISVGDMRKCLQQVAETEKDAEIFGEVKGRQIRSALSELGRDLERAKPGFTLEEVSGGFRLQSVPSCGRWLKALLQAKPQRLSRPALETLAIIAYRQPITRAEIEAIRGVSVGHVVKSLMELHLVKIAGRSELPGKPFLYGTTPSFLTHFGLKDIKDLQKMAPLTLARRAAQSVGQESPITEEGEATATPAEPVHAPVAEAEVTPVAEAETEVEPAVEAETDAEAAVEPEADAEAAVEPEAAVESVADEVSSDEVVEPTSDVSDEASDKAES